MRKSTELPLCPAMLRDMAETLAHGGSDLGDERACIAAIERRGYQGPGMLSHLEPAIEDARVIRASFVTVGSELREAAACIFSLAIFVGSILLITPGG